MIFLSCSTEKTKPIYYGMPDVDVSSLKTDYQAWWTYHYNEINLTSDFIALDQERKPIDKDAFFAQLMTGNFIPVKLAHEGKANHYELYALDDTWNKNVSSTIAPVSGDSYFKYQKQGEPFPVFSFIDLDGNTIDKKSIQDNYLLVKCWFIACKPCIEEMPALNVLKEEYEKRGDFVFVSLAIDEAEPLRKFLTKREFNYPVVAEQGEFMLDEMGVNTYPTHILVGKDGLIKKWVNKLEDLEEGLQEIVE